MIYITIQPPRQYYKVEGKYSLTRFEGEGVIEHYCDSLEAAQAKQSGIIKAYLLDELQYFYELLNASQKPVYLKQKKQIQRIKDGLNFIRDKDIQCHIEISKTILKMENKEGLIRGMVDKNDRLLQAIADNLMNVASDSLK